jgi:hypothetical protein
MIPPYTFIFVSHVSEDRAAATALVSKLEGRGIACWIAPRDVNPGRPFDTEIADAIDTCRVMLLVFSERCNESDYIRREVTVAGDVGKVIIPYRIEDARPKGGLRVRLSDLHWIDAFDAPERAFEELMRTVVPDAKPSGASIPIVPQETIPSARISIPGASTSGPHGDPAPPSLAPQGLHWLARRPVHSIPSASPSAGDVVPAALSPSLASQGLEWLTRRPVLTGVVSVVALGMLVSVGIYSLSPGSLSVSPSAQLSAAGASQNASAPVSTPPQGVAPPAQNVGAAPSPPPAKRPVEQISPPQPPSAEPALAAAPPPPQAQDLSTAPASFPRRVTAVRFSPPKEAPVKPLPETQPPPRSGWLIQVGAFPNEDAAKQRLIDVQTKASEVLASADPYTQAVQKGDSIYYRARFGGFDKDQAEAACKYIKRVELDCVAVKN